VGTSKHFYVRTGIHSVSKMFFLFLDFFEHRTRDKDKNVVLIFLLPLRKAFFKMWNDEIGTFVLGFELCIYI
jgi:hypothetical protein